jgi:hypothetical protein
MDERRDNKVARKKSNRKTHERRGAIFSEAARRRMR